MKHINLENLANGAFTAQVNRAIEEVTKNIQDPNTEPGATRKITVTIGFKPNQERNFVATGVQTKTTLAPALGAVTAFSMGKDIATGAVEAVEVNTGQIPGQMSMEDMGQQAPQAADTIEVDGKAVDPETGEIKSDKVVDLRKHKEDKIP